MTKSRESIPSFAKRYVGKARRLKTLPDYPIGVFDFETERIPDVESVANWKPAIRGIGFRYGGMEHPEVISSVKEFWEILKASVHQYPGIRWYVHNGGEYDFKFLLYHLQDEILRDGQTSFVVGGGQRVVHWETVFSDQTILHLYDSYSLMPVSLEKLAKVFAKTQKAVGVIDWTHEEFDIENPKHREYLLADVEALWEIVKNYRETIWRVFGIDHAYTAPSTALRAWRVTIPKGERFWRTSRYAEDFAREAYYGGLVRAKDTVIHNDVVSWDTNSMYPSVYRLPMPVGAPGLVDRYVPGYPGIYRVRVEAPSEALVPDMLLGIPKRDKGTVFYPRGRYETVITSEEWEWARAHGYRLTFVEGMIWEQSKPIFEEFVNTCEALRQQDYSGPVGMIAKIMQNSLYGKFGTGLVHVRMVASLEPPGLEWTAYMDSAGRESEWLWTKDEEIDAPYLMPHWAAFTTARARLALLRMIETIGVEAFVYSDTDSVKFERQKVAYERLKAEYVGPAYGQWKEEGVYDRFRAIAPKVYYGITPDGREEIRAKGVPYSLLSVELLDKAAEGMISPIDFVQGHSMRVILKGWPFWVLSSRSLTIPAHVRAWRHDAATGQYRAIDWQDYEASLEVRDQTRQQIEEDRLLRKYWKQEKLRLRRLIMPIGIREADYPYIPRGWLRRRGRSLTEWAQCLGYPDGDTFYAVLQNIYLYG